MKGMKRLEGIVIQKREHREADWVYVLYTKEWGRVQFLAKGARKIGAKLRAHLELFNWVECYFVEGRTMRIVTDVRVIERFSQNLIQDALRLKCAYHLMGYFESQVKGEERDPRLWGFLVHGVRILSRNGGQKKEKEIRLFIPYVFLRLSQLLGFAPELYHCTMCRRRLRAGERYFFRVREGGVACSSCGGANDISLDERTIKLLRMMLGGDWSTVKRLKVSVEEGRALETLSQMVPAYFS